MASTLREKIVKLAHAVPETRKYLVPLLQKQALEFPTQEALDKYLKAHPKADKGNHSVAEGKGGKGGKKPEPQKVDLKKTSDEVASHLKSSLRRMEPGVVVDDVYHGPGFTIITVMPYETYKKEDLTEAEQKYQSDLEAKLEKMVRDKLGDQAKDLVIRVNTSGGLKDTNNIEITIEEPR